MVTDLEKRVQIAVTKIEKELAEYEKAGINTVSVELDIIGIGRSVEQALKQRGYRTVEVMGLTLDDKRRAIITVEK